MHPLSNTMERQQVQNQGDIMGDTKEQFGSANSLDNAERKRYFHVSFFCEMILIKTQLHFPCHEPSQ